MSRDDPSSEHRTPAREPRESPADVRGFDPHRSPHLLLADALALPVEDRRILADKLRESIEHPESVAQAIDDAQFAEVERRWRDIESGQAKLIPWEEVRAELLADD